MRRSLPAALLACPLLLALGIESVAQEGSAAASDAAPRIYKWVDENGIAHYTTDPKRIPQSLRSRAERLGGADVPLERQPLEARAPRDEYDAWAVRNRRALSERRDVWDEALESEASPMLTAEERAVLAAEQAEVEQRIAELETEIAADEDAIKTMISDAETDPLERGDDPTFRDIALRLPKRLAELRALRDRQAELETGR